MVCNSCLGVASPLAKPASTQSQWRVGLELASRRWRNARTAPRRPRLDTSQSTSMIVSYTPARRALLLLPSHTALREGREGREAFVTETGRLLRDFVIILWNCVAVTRHDFCVTPSRLIEGTAARPSYDSPTNCVTGPRLTHDLHGIIILIHDRRTTPSRRFHDLCVTAFGYIKSWSCPS